MHFEDRTDAGRRLGAEMAGAVGPDVVVLGVPRGGVPVAREVARALDAPLDVLVVAAPGRAELREAEYRGGLSPARLDGRVAAVVDEGATTGATAEQACRLARGKGASRVVLGLPVARAASLDGLGRACDQLICLHAPRSFWTVGLWYGDFETVSDTAVRAVLREARGLPPLPAAPAAAPAIRREDVGFRPGDSTCGGLLAAPPSPAGLVIRGVRRGDGGYSPLDRRLESCLVEGGLATLRVDLLHDRDDRDARNLPVLAERFAAAAAWARARPDLAGLGVGFYGAGTAGAAALVASTLATNGARAVVTHAARADVARRWLAQVTVPTLFIVGERDERLREINRGAQAMLAGRCRLALVPGATAAEAGATDGICRLATAWFLDHLGPGAGTVAGFELASGTAVPPARSPLLARAAATPGGGARE